MAFTVDLGIHVYSSPYPGLKLVQHATALVLPPRGTTGLDVTGNYEALQNGKEWLDQTPELKLHAQVRIGPHIDSSSFFSQIGEVVCHSRIWLDLGLDVLFTSCNQVVESDHSTTIHFSFALRKKIKPMNTSKSLRIPAGMRDLRDPIPPEGIPTAHLSAIDLYFEYIECSQGMVGVEKNESVFKNSENILESDIGHNKPDEALDESICLHGKFPHLEGLSTAEKTASSALKEGQRESERNSINQSSNTSKIYPMPPPVSPPSEKTLHTLFSNSFRNIIVGDFPETRKKLKPANKGIKSLSQLCPSVFSLGYREAMGQRSQFIPSIATSISSILQRTKNPILQRRASIIASSTDPSGPDLSPAPLKKATIRAALKQALWQNSQKQLYDPEKSRHLSPLKYSSYFEGNRLALKETALFDTSTTGETEIIDTDGEDNYGSDYYLGTEIEEFGSLESHDEAEKTDSLLSLTEDYADLSIDMFPTSIKDRNLSEPAKLTDEMNIDFDMESSVDMDMDMDVECQDHADEFYVLPPASRLSVKSPHSNDEMLNSDCPEYDTELMDPFCQSTAGASVIPDQEELIIDEDFDDILYDLNCC